MKVKDLIEQLLHYDRNATVFIQIGDTYKSLDKTETNMWYDQVTLLDKQI